MLVLSRHRDEGIVFDGPARVVVLEVRGGNVRLGVIAPQSTRVLRDEVARAVNFEVQPSLEFYLRKAA